jgi:squalene-hopene/tetraprenyl-beta-curcumene cyclase
VEGEINPAYGTARVIRGLASPLALKSPDIEQARRRCAAWLLAAQNPAGYWGGAAGAPASIEETGVILEALAMPDRSFASQDLDNALEKGARWLIEASAMGQRTPPAPIGLYFARLWYYEDLYPLIFALRGLRRVQCRRQGSHLL